MGSPGPRRLRLAVPSTRASPSGGYICSIKVRDWFVEEVELIVADSLHTKVELLEGLPERGESGFLAGCESLRQFRFEHQDASPFDLGHLVNGPVRGGHLGPEVDP
jgi:hypothetical protein